MTDRDTARRPIRVARRVALPVTLLSLLLAAPVPPASPAGDGTLDPSFSGDGEVTADFGGYEGAYAIALQTNGKIVVAGGGSILDLARYDADGNLDPSFSGDGKVSFDFTGGTNGANGVAVQGDGRIVAAGYAWVGNSPGSRDFALVRFLPDGEFDDSFSGDGKQTSDFAGNQDYGNSLALQPDGKIVVVGQSGDGVTSDFAVARYLPDGELDTSFSDDGLLTTDFGGSDYGNAVALQPDGKIVAAGGSDSSFAVARYNADGSPDLTFSGDGLLTTDFTDSARGSAVALQPDGEIVVAGQEGSSFALARYDSDGSLDPTFGVDGRATTGVPDAVVAAAALARQGDGKLVAAGIEYQTGGGHDFVLARYLPDGTPDPSFGGGGLVATDFGGYNGATALAIQPDGRILAAGQADGDFGVARYLGPEPADRSVTVAVSGKKVRLRGRHATLRLTCPVSEVSPPCAGTLTLRTSKKVPYGRHHRRVVLATGRFSIGPGATSKVKLHLSRRTAALVRSVPKARRVKAIVDVQDSAGNHATVVQGLKLVLRAQS